MNPSEKPVVAADGEELTFAQKRRRVVGALLHAIDAAEPGTVAELKRMSPELPSAAFYRLTTGLLDAIEPASGDRRDAADRRWTVVARAMALGRGLHGNVRLGAALAHADVAELRMLRLLEAHGTQLADALFGVLHQLVSKGQTWSPYDVAELVLSDGEPFESSVRRTLAREFYRND